jgi:hypothetical protein
MKNTLLLLDTSRYIRHGTYKIEEVNILRARELVHDAESVMSGVERAEMAAEISDLLGTTVEISETVVTPSIGQKAIVCSTKERCPAGKILSKEELHKIGLIFQVMTRIE